MARGTTRSGPQAPQAGAAPALEMSFSESTDHWLAEGDTLSDAADGAAALHPASTRRRDMAVIGGAIVLGLALIWILRGHAGTNNPAVPAAVPGDVATAATVLTHRAESALADGKAERALDLARQAILADPWYADAYAVVGSAHRSAGRRDEARTAYRRYLDLAPNGRQAATVKAQLDRLDNGG